MVPGYLVPLESRVGQHTILQEPQQRRGWETVQVPTHDASEAGLAGRGRGKPVQLGKEADHLCQFHLPCLGVEEQVGGGEAERRGPLTGDWDLKLCY